MVLCLIFVIISYFVCFLYIYCMFDDFIKNELLKMKFIMYLICVKDLSFEGVNSFYLFLEN